MLEWRKIKDYPFEVSNEGAVRCESDKELLNICVTRWGYKYVAFHSKSFGVHRLVAAAFIVNTEPQRTLVAHKDGNPSNNHVNNLRWSTHKENMADRKLHGKNPRYAVWKKLRTENTLAVPSGKELNRLLGLQ